MTQTARKEAVLPAGRILVVEDDPVLARFWLKLLQEVPCDYFRVSQSAVEAIDFLNESAADLLITDLTFPDATALDVIQKAREANPAVKTVVTSGFVGDPSQFSGTHQFIHVLQKPYNNVNSVRELVKLLLQNSVEISGVESDEDHDGVYVWEL